MARRRRRGSGVKWLKHYSSAQSILVVGDGDFSFSLALATAFGSGGNIVATSLDSYGALIGKYSQAEANVMDLNNMGTKVLHNINAKNMTGHHDLRVRQFDRIVFNFPHAGFKGREEEMRVIKLHTKLVKGFLGNARHLLKPYGEIHISHKMGYPYDAWDIERLASESSLATIEIVSFHKHHYPGYNQKKGDGPRCNQPFPLGACCTYKFCLQYY
ncbi:heavy metal-associated isoprenylated plant protein 41-like [Lolium rigidum]|uniref:heavy metal-associated isoprenylated plant protein 41-like n=1 Tax=Lolium rigidum TaxID=89674 RepID=UPI001F5C9D98|nr:heavy metal-associated isoprenylated plant protein 41-like [Lolium rigidum]